MKKSVLTVLVLAGCGVALRPPSPSRPRATEAKASLVLTGGRVWTGDPATPWATAIAVGPEGILAVGDDAAVAGFGPRPDARRIALAGRFVMPGINDAHIHFLRGSLRLTQLDLNGARSLEEIQARLARFAKDNPPVAGNPWIQGDGWQYTVMPGGRLPTRQDLDAIVADRPIFLAAYDGHTGWANSAALALARVDGEDHVLGLGRDRQGRARRAHRRLQGAGPERHQRRGSRRPPTTSNGPPCGAGSRARPPSASRASRTPTARRKTSPSSRRRRRRAS